MKCKIGFILFLICAPVFSGPHTDRAKIYLQSQDDIGFRMYMQSIINQNLNFKERSELRNLISENVTKVGFDLMYVWDRSLARFGGNHFSSKVQIELARADEAMLNRRFQEAFGLYQNIALALKNELKKKSFNSRQASLLYPYVLHSMGRALYGAGRFAESYDVLNWMPMNYAKFRQTLFEKMWASFRAGAVDRALGAVASQRSELFSSYLQPEAYLVQVYIYKRLCRENDLRGVLAEMRRFQNDLRSQNFGVKDWARMDVEGRVLWAILENNKFLEGDTLFSAQQKNAEKERIRRVLMSRFEMDRARWLENLSSALSYAQLSLKGQSSFLKPIEKLPSRAKLYQMELEIWPSDKAEEWLDEVGSHRFVGESQCAMAR